LGGSFDRWGTVERTPPTGSVSMQGDGNHVHCGTMAVTNGPRHHRGGRKKTIPKPERTPPPTIALAALEEFERSEAMRVA